MRQRTFLFTTLLVGRLSLSPAGATAARPGRSGTLPPLMLWAWERPADLRALDGDIGIAFYAQTVSIRQSGITVTPRRNPLRVAERTALVAVTRIESDGNGAGGLSEAAIDAVAEAIASTTRRPRVSGVQIDFDAAESERSVYRRLIGAARARLVDSVPLSITALASWCTGDRWLVGLPVDEVVPMLFRMGPSNQPYASIATAPVTAARLRLQSGAVNGRERGAGARGPRMTRGEPRSYLITAALDWARSRPTGPDAAKALALAIEGWRWSPCASSTVTSGLPSQAFTVLHRQFPDGEGARRTKYWYD